MVKRNSKPEESRHSHFEGHLPWCHSCQSSFLQMILHPDWLEELTCHENAVWLIEKGSCDYLLTNPHVSAYVTDRDCHAGEMAISSPNSV